MIQFVKTSWFKGNPFYFNEFVFNNGNPYRSYRFLCLMIKIYKKSKGEK